ncbi:MAG: hypothetical protein HY820_29915 [Acidobacteria bacterium]|nr:hypothetical protein [Acidobacteriota bacterium]
MKKTAMVGKRRSWPNTMMFPKALRDAIPDMPTCGGRVLELDAIHGEPVNSHLFGERVQVKLRVKETGKLTGKFVVLIDLQPEAARALATTLTNLADQLEEAP